MPKFTMKDGVLTAEEFEPATFDYVCQKGTSSNVTMQFPKGLTVNSILNISNGKCPCCDEEMSLPRGKHSVKDGRLVSEYEEEPGAPS